MELDPLVNTLRHKVARVDAEILAAVRQQATSGSRARADLAAAKSTIEELFAKIHEIQRKAEQSDLMVQVRGWVMVGQGDEAGAAGAGLSLLAVCKPCAHVRCPWRDAHGAMGMVPLHDALSRRSVVTSRS